MNLILIAQGIPGLGTDFCNAIQISIDIGAASLVVDVGHEALEAECLYRWKLRLFRLIESLFRSVPRHGSQHSIPSRRDIRGKRKHTPYESCRASTL